MLAKQHAATIAARLRPFGASVELLNRNVKESERVAGLCKLHPELTRSLKAPAFPTPCT